MSVLDPKRKGIFTASEIHRLISNGASYEPCEFSQDYTCYEKVKNGSGYEYVPICEPPKGKKNVYRYNEDYLTDGAETYAEEKAGAFLYYEREQPQFSSFSTQYGTDHEWLAVEWIEQELGIKLDYTGDNQQFFIHPSGMFGATPDGIMIDDDFNYALGIEIKCPDQNTHTFNCLKVKTTRDLQKHYPAYYWQCLAGMLATGADNWIWCSFAPDKITNNKRGHIVEIDLSYAILDMHFMMKCIEKAHKLKLRIIEEMR